jgi:predicted DNA-binding ribbon-helix-helix protein
MAPKQNQPHGQPRKNTPMVKRSVKIAGRRTSLTLEDAFWNSFKEIANSRNTSVHDLASMINKKRHGSLSSALRLFVLDHYRQRV